MTKPGPDDGFLRGLEIGLVLSILLWVAIMVLVYTGWNVG